MRSQSSLLTLCAAAAVLLGGCSSHEAASAGSPTPGDVNARVQQIQNDPHIPPQARQNIVGAMQQGRNAARPSAR